MRRNICQSHRYAEADILQRRTLLRFLMDTMGVSPGPAVINLVTCEGWKNGGAAPGLRTVHVQTGSETRLGVWAPPLELAPMGQQPRQCRAGSKLPWFLEGVVEGVRSSDEKLFLGEDPSTPSQAAGSSSTAAPADTAIVPMDASQKGAGDSNQRLRMATVNVKLTLEDVITDAWQTAAKDKKGPVNTSARHQLLDAFRPVLVITLGGQASG